MKEYGFDYLNYITNIPNNMNYSQIQNPNLNITMSNQMPNMLQQTQQLLDPPQGWMRGNMFANLYDPYKNYKPEDVKPQNERQALLYQIMQYKFALTDLNLYLDTHPNDDNAIQLYNNYLNNEKQMCDKYESMYGPLTLDSEHLDKNTWVWKKSPWPWEVV